MEQLEIMSIRQIPQKYQKMYDRRNKSRKFAIWAFCLKCVEYSQSEVDRYCNDACPLFKWRVKG